MKNETDALNELIILLQEKRAAELLLFKEQLHTTYESLKPINLVKNTFHEMTSSTEIKNEIISNAIGIGTGFISKKLLIGSSHNPIKRVVGTLLQFAVANLVSKHSEGIKSVGSNLIQRLLKSGQEPKQELHNY